jgi:hypothetical protein
MGLLDDLFEIVFPRKQYGTPSTTKLGVEVRSRAEQKIADYFDSINLRYDLPDYDVYVEYWGMLNVDNDYDRSKYTRAMKYKMARYHDLGVKFISIYPDNIKNLDWIFRKKFKQVAGFDLPRKRK